MPRNILVGVADDLADKVENATDHDRRAISVAVCKLAVSAAGLDSPLVAIAVRSLENGVCKDDGITSGLERLVGDFDNNCFAAQRGFEQGECPQATYRELFGKARAASAVLLAFNDDSFVAATHAVYEACAAVGADATRSVVERILVKP